MVTSIDTRGFDYPLEPVRQRSHHRVETAAGKLGETQRDLSKAREEVKAAIERCRALAMQFTPAAKAAIDPHRAIAAANRMVALRTALVAAEEEEAAMKRAVELAQAELDQARIERETFETHRAELLAEHAVEQARRFQAQADQDWLARRSFADAREAGEKERSNDEAR